MNAPAPPQRILIVAGEASGDLHGAHLVDALKRKHDSIECCGVGGKAMAAAGVRLVVDAASLSVVGITEVISRLPQILKGLAKVKQQLTNFRPDMVILIDFPDFNLRIAAAAKKMGIPVLYYISPQIWAWRSKRVVKIGRLVDHMAVILPFEEPFYREHHIPVTFVGHPLMDEYADIPATPLPLPVSTHPVIGLLPGSRESEIRRILPVMLESALKLSRKLEQVRFVISVAPGAPQDIIEALSAPYASQLSIELNTGGARAVFPQVHLAVAASGTVTLEAAINDTPVVIVYKVSPFSYHLGRALIQVAHIGLVNLIAGKEIAPELIQNHASPENIAAAVYRLVTSPPALNTMRQNFATVRTRLGGPGASARVADIALKVLGLQYLR